VARTARTVRSVEGASVRLVKLRLWWEGVVRFWRSLRRHPTAVAGLAVTLLFVFVALAAPWLAPCDPGEQDLTQRLRSPAWGDKPTAGHLLGTDQLGRDLLARIIYGARVSIAVGFLSVLISVGVGTALGCLAGYWRGALDEVLSRFADLLMAFPFLIFTIGAMAMLGPGFWNLIIALSFKGWVEFFRLVRGEVLGQKGREYVDAARALGRSDAAIIGFEILPNITHSILVLATLRLGHMIVLEASLSFLGLGIPPRIPAWGSMVNDGRETMMVAYWISTFPGLALVALVLGINLFGEGLRDILDPRLKVESFED